MTREEIIQAISNDKMMPFIQPEQLAQIVAFVIENYRPSLPSNLDEAVENISDKHLAEMSVEYSLHCKIEDGTRHAIMNWSTFQKIARKFIDIGKTEALKDLPRWKEINNAYYLDKEGFDRKLGILFYRGNQISIAELRKLIGFKED